MVGIGLNWCFFIGRENEPLDVEMLLELMHTVVRADRVLSDPSGRSLLLIGRSGVGRHTSIKLLSVMHHARIMTPFPGRNYGRKQYTNDLKSVNYKIIRIISP
jgi:dynein heavy chain 2